jgi:hypothetical protein
VAPDVRSRSPASPGGRPALLPCGCRTHCTRALPARARGTAGAQLVSASGLGPGMPASGRRPRGAPRAALASALRGSRALLSKPRVRRVRLGSVCSRRQTVGVTSFTVCPLQDWASFTASLKLRLYAKKVTELKTAIQAEPSGCPGARFDDQAEAPRIRAFGGCHGVPRTDSAADSAVRRATVSVSWRIRSELSTVAGPWQQAPGGPFSRQGCIAVRPPAAHGCCAGPSTCFPSLSMGAASRSSVPSGRSRLTSVRCMRRGCGREASHPVFAEWVSPGPATRSCIGRGRRSASAPAVPRSSPRTQIAARRRPFSRP